MGSFEQDRQHSERGEKPSRGRADRAPAVPDPLVSQVIALQQSAGNAAVSRLVARSPLLQRQPAPDGSPLAAPAPPTPAAPGSQADALVAMTQTAWETGVVQREQAAADLLSRPQAGKRELNQADMMLDQAMGAANSIGMQFATLAPDRLEKARGHEKDISIDRAEMIPLMQKTTPGDIAANISELTVGLGKRAMAEVAAPLPAGPAPQAESGGSAPAPAPAPARGFPPPGGMSHSNR